MAPMQKTPINEKRSAESISLVYAVSKETVPIGTVFDKAHRVDGNALRRLSIALIRLMDCGIILIRADVSGCSEV